MGVSLPLCHNVESWRTQVTTILVYLWNVLPGWMNDKKETVKGVKDERARVERAKVINNLKKIKG